MKVFVTGAAGFIGRAVTAELAKKGHEVIGMVVNDNDGRIVQEAGGRYVVGDLMQGGQWCSEVRDVDKVISLTQPLKSDENITLDKASELGHIHAESVTNLIKAAADGRAKAIIVTNHSTCFGDRGGRWVSDADTIEPIGYCRPMSGSFEAIQRTAEDAELPLIQVYPALVYGNGSWFKRLINNFLDSNAHVVEPGNNYLSLIHVEDLAGLYAMIVEKVDTNETFCLSDDRPVVQRVLMDYIADMLDRQPVPMVDFKAYARENGILAAETMSSSTRVPGKKAIDSLEYVPRIRSYETGIPYTLKSMGIEPRKRLLKVSRAA